MIIVAQHLGKSTMQMGTLKPGEAFAGLTGPLGWPIKNRRYGTVVCVGGGHIEFGLWERFGGLWARE